MTKQVIKVAKISENDGPSEGFVTQGVFADRSAKLKTPEGIELNLKRKNGQISKEVFEAELKKIQIPS